MCPLSGPGAWAPGLGLGPRPGLSGLCSDGRKLGCRMLRWRMPLPVAGVAACGLGGTWALPLALQLAVAAYIEVGMYVYMGEAIGVWKKKSAGEERVRGSRAEIYGRLVAQLKNTLDS